MPDSKIPQGGNTITPATRLADEKDQRKRMKEVLVRKNTTSFRELTISSSAKISIDPIECDATRLVEEEPHEAREEKKKNLDVPFNVFSDPNFIYDSISLSEYGIIFMEQVIDKEYSCVMKFLEFKGPEFIDVRELHRSRKHLIIRSSCNGLLLVQEDREEAYRIVSPVTKQCIAFPPFDDQRLWHDLVYVPSSKEYIIAELVFETIEPGLYCGVLTLKTLGGSSRRIQVGKDIMHNGRASRVSINGVLYWISSSKDIVSFDVYTEKFRLLKYTIDEKYCCTTRLTNLGGYLSVVEFLYPHRINKLFNIWICKDIDKNEWVKLPSFNRNVVGIGEDQHYIPSNVVGSLDNGDVLVFTDYWKRVAAYDVKTMEWRLIRDKKNEKDKVTYSYHVHVNRL